MSELSDAQILAKLRRKAKTAAELGVSRWRLIKLEAKGEVTRAGVVKTGRRGRPAVVWAATA